MIKGDEVLGEWHYARSDGTTGKYNVLFFNCIISKMRLNENIQDYRTIIFSILKLISYYYLININGKIW